MIEDRMIELTFQAWHGNYEEIIKLAEASGINIEYNERVLSFKGRGEYPKYSNVPTAIYSGLDPATIFICLGFAFFGMFWPNVMPGALEKLNKRWREEIKNKKEMKAINKKLEDYF